MPADDLDAELKIFLRVHATSYEQLEILLYLRSAQRDWSAEELARELRLNGSATESALETLQEKNLIVARAPTGEGVLRFAYQAQGKPADQVLERIAHELQERPATLLRVLSAHALERLRTRAAYAFADAFVLRKDKSDG